MTNQLNKLQIKAEILTVISKLQTNIDAANVEAILSTLMEQEDKKNILELLIKELIKSNEQKVVLISFLMLKLCKSEDIENALWDVLKMPSVSDATKTIILNLLKDMGNKIEYDKLEEFFDNPNEVIDADTQKLLQTAIINPEAQIDFLDFINSLSEKDSKILIESLGEDYSSDELANILNPLALYNPESKLGNIAINILGETKSQLALHALLESLEFVEDEETIAIIKKNISKLKISGVREDNATEFYRNILDSKPYESYASFPDGHGNQAIIFSRQREDETIQMVAIVINDSWGLIDCFGFNEISKSEFERIIDKFYKGDEHIYINPTVAKKLLTNAEKLTRKINGRISYEYVCWKTLLSDIDSEPVPIELILKSNFQQKTLSDEELEQIYMFDFIQKWFFDTEYNNEFKLLIDQFNNKIEANDFNINFDAEIKEHLENIFTTAQKNFLDKRILMSAYLKYLSGKNEDCELLYSLYYDEEKKLKLAENIIRKSIYEYYVSIKFKQKEENKMTNIFALKNKQKTVTLTLKQIESVVKIIENLWVK